MPSEVSRPSFIVTSAKDSSLISQKCPLIVSVGVLIEPLSEPEVLNSSSRLGV